MFFCVHGARKSQNTTKDLAFYEARGPNTALRTSLCPTEGEADVQNDLSYEQLNIIMLSCKRKDIKIAVSNLNVKVGANKKGLEDVIGSERFGDGNNSREVYRFT